MKLSSKIMQIQSSGSMAFFKRVQELKDSGRQIISLATGELDSPTPEKTKQAGIKAIENNQTRYTTNEGLLELRQEISKTFLIEKKLEYSPDEILITAGAKQAIYNLLVTLCNKDDEVIIFSPYYPTYIEQVKLCEGLPKIVPLYPENNYQINQTELENNISDKTKIIIINSPNNPTGSIFNSKSLEILSELVIKHNLWLISDEIYEKIIFKPASFQSPASLNQEMKKRTLIVSGFSKSFAMTGWRLGYCVGDRDIISKAALVQSHTTSNACTISQYAALTALRADSDYIKTLLPELEQKRNLVSLILNPILPPNQQKPSGAFYFLIPIIALDESPNNSDFSSSSDFANYLLENYDVAVVPGDAFGAPNYLRISFAASLKDIEIGCQRILKGIEQISK